MTTKTLKRKLVTRRKISNIEQIKGADFIVKLTIDGWHCVGKKGEFEIGDECIYFEIDSFLPKSDPRFDFLMKSGVREFNGEIGHRLRTVRLRKQISQGLALPIRSFPELDGLKNDSDMAPVINVVKYDPPVPACIAGELKGNFPSFIPKTDQERCQNIEDEIFVENKHSKYEVTVKLDGTSMTAYVLDGMEGVCMRNYELKISDSNKDNSLVKIARSGLLLAIAKSNINIAIQGELMGPKIQGNREKLPKPKFFVYDIFDIDANNYLSAEDRMRFFNDFLADLDDVAHVPVISPSMQVPTDKLDELILFADGESINNAVREGLVWKRLDGGFSFKTISNRFLLKGGD